MNALLLQAKKWFNELDIHTEDGVGFLKVNRTDLFNFGTTDDVFTTMLLELRSAIGTNKFIWAAKDDDWLYLETF